jgi:hypothetical protein
MRLIRVTQTPWIRSSRDRGALTPVAERPQRILAALARASIAPVLSGRLPVPPALGAVVRALGGRLVVTNPVAVARLPQSVGLLARDALGSALRTSTDDMAEPLPSLLPRAAAAVPGLRMLSGGADHRLAALLARLPAESRAALAPGATWVAAALYEPDALDVELPQDGPTPIAPEPLPLVARSRYRLVLAAGRGTAPTSWHAIDEAGLAAPATAWPPGSEGQPWFVVRLLIADALVSAGMDATTLARWAALTGRAGPGSRDLYWHVDSWERFREPGRLVGHVTPQVIGQSRRTRRVGTSDAFGLALTPDTERGVGVPPGYCLVDCAGLLDVAVLAA